MKWWGPLLAALILAHPAAAQRIVYTATGTIGSITPGVVPGAGLPSSFAVGDAFFYRVTLDTSQPLIIVEPGIFLVAAHLELEIDAAILDAPGQQVYAVVNCTYSFPCDFSIERTVSSGPKLPFGDDWVGSVGLAARFANEYISGTGLGEPLVPNGEATSLFVSTCLPSTSCPIDYNALGTVESIEVVQSVPALGLFGTASLAALLCAVTRRVAESRGAETR